jgi:ribosome-binding protein aMBF1 (putative translation factor)
MMNYCILLLSVQEGVSMEKQEKWLSDLGTRLKAEKEKQGLTQQALAEK